MSIHEPRIALDGGANGLDVYNVLIPMAQKRANVAVAVSVEFTKRNPLNGIMTQSGLHSTVIHKDLTGIERVVVGKV